MEIYCIEFDLDGEYRIYKVGENEIVKINQHSAQGDGDKWYWEVIYKSGCSETIFNTIYRVMWKPLSV